MPAEKRYCRIMLGRASAFAGECHTGQFVGGDWGIKGDLTQNLTANWRDFNAKYIPVFLAANPDKKKVTAGLACGMLHTICKGLQQGDIVLCPNGERGYYVGEIASDYFYVPGGILPHRRKVTWYPKVIGRDEMSEALLRSAGSIGTVSDISKHAAEIERLIAGIALPTLISTDELVEDPSVFALEKHLEEFLIQNWTQTELGKTHNIFEEDGESAGQQYPTDTGNIDVLAVRKDGKELLIVELKKGRASDAVVGQVQRYMGYIQDEIAEDGQQVRGCIIALEDDIRLRRALRVAPNIDFYRYQVSFKLHKV